MELSSLVSSLSAAVLSGASVKFIQLDFSTLKTDLTVSVHVLDKSNISFFKFILCQKTRN